MAYKHFSPSTISNLYKFNTQNYEVARIGLKPVGLQYKKVWSIVLHELNVLLISKDPICFHLLSSLINWSNKIFMSQIFSTFCDVNENARFWIFIICFIDYQHDKLIFSKLIELILTSPTSCLPSHIFSSSSSKSSISLELYIYNSTILSYSKFWILILNWKLPSWMFVKSFVKCWTKTPSILYFQIFIYYLQIIYRSH